MELNSQLLNEAVADAKAIRETAVQTAIARLTETFEPTVRELITTKLSEEEDEMEDEMEMEPEAPDTDVMDMEPEAPAPEAPAQKDPEIDELEELLRELEAEEDDEMPVMDGYDVDLETENVDLETEKDDFVTEADLDEIIAELEGSGMGGEKEIDEEEVELMASGKKWKNENAKLKADLAEAMSVIKQQKEAISEVNLLNSKLLFLTKVTNKHKMTPNQQYKILEAFDRAQSVREVKLIYATIVENLTAPAEKSPKVRNSRNKLSEAASTPVRAIKRASKSNDSYDFAPRWKELANITK